MSEDHTSQIENAPTSEEALREEALQKSEQADDGLVDRTHELIDEVSQLLDTSDSSPDSVSKEPVATPPEATSSIEVDADLTAAATLKSFLDSLGKNDSNESTEFSDAGVQPEAEVQGEANSLEADEPNVAAGEELLETETDGDTKSEESSIDLSALTVAFKENAAVEATVTAHELEDKPVPETDTTEEAEASEHVESDKNVDANAESDRQSVESWLSSNIMRDSTETVLMDQIPTGEVSTEAVSTEEEPVAEATVTAPQFEDKPVLEADEIDQSPASEATEELDEEQDATQKYLDELRPTFGDESEEAEASEHIENEENNDADDESDVPSVESWLANVMGVPAETAPTEEASTEAVSTEAVSVQENPVEDLTNTEDSADAVAEDSGESNVTDVAEAGNATNSYLPTVVFGQQDDLVEGESLAGSFEAGELSRLQAAFNSRLQKLEDRIGGMFSSISDQIDRLAQPGMVSQGQSVVVGGSNEETVGESGEQNLESAPDSVEASQPAGDGDKVEVLKEQLKSKLREAEIELSINRAKLSQQRAKIEQMQADLERREAAVDAKLERAKSNTTSTDKKGGMMDRWKRHLGE